MRVGIKLAGLVLGSPSHRLGESNRATRLGESFLWRRLGYPPWSTFMPGVLIEFIDCLGCFLYYRAIAFILESAVMFDELKKADAAGKKIHLLLDHSQAAKQKRTKGQGPGQDSKTRLPHYHDCRA
jgi:hypothetical protein